MKNKIKKLSRFLNKWEWLILIVGLVVIFRIPSFFEPHHYGDEEIYFVMGRAWREGVPLYAGAFDHKPPLIYILAGIANSVAMFRIILAIWMVIHTILFWLVSAEVWRRVLGKGKKNVGQRAKLTFATTSIFAILTTIPRLEGHIANGELFMMMPITAAVYLLLKSKKGEWKRYFSAGLLAGIGLLFKIPVLFDFLGILAFFFIFREETFWKSLKGIFAKELWITGVGFLVPVVATVVYYFSQGIGQEYLQGALLINFGYVSSWSTSSYSFNPFKSGLFVRGLILLGFSGLLYLVRNRVSKMYVLALLWYAFSLFGSILSGRPYPHYLLQVVVPLSLLIGFIATLKKNYWGWVMMMIAVAMGVATWISIGFWYYPTISYYQNFVEGTLKIKSNEEYLYYYSNLKMDVPLAKYLNARMDEDDQLYVWGTDSTVYNLTDKLPAGGKYIVSFHVRDFRAWDEVMEHLKVNEPKFIVVLPEPIEFPEMFAWLEQEYIVTTEVEGALVYIKL